jgi:DNA-binding response OmpR family regulator
MSCRTVFTTLQWEDQYLMVSHQGRPDPRRRVLVVDDEEAIRTLLTVFLESREFAVRTAPDGASALALLQTEPAEVILVDWHMPGISGLDMAVEVRRTNPHIPIALMTGTPRAIQPATLQQVGISRMFVKPFDLEELLAWIRTLLL